jgi:hypothetical protein
MEKDIQKVKDFVQGCITESREKKTTQWYVVGIWETIVVGHLTMSFSNTPTRLWIS